jgi:hypothetical protein
VAGLEHERRDAADWEPRRSVSDEPVTSRDGSVEISTFAGQLFTKKMVVGDPAARSYFLCRFYFPTKCHFGSALERRSNFGFRARQLNHIKQLLRDGEQRKHQGFLSILLDLLNYFAYGSFYRRAQT